MVEVLSDRENFEYRSFAEIERRLIEKGARG
jgi:hypothetical protein